jgi:predicted transcriptional regulator
MIQDWFETIVNKRGFAVSIHMAKSGEFEVDSDDVRSMISLLLERRRQQSGLSLAQAADRLRVKSRNAYARYERGESVPTLEKLDRLLKAVSRHRGLVVKDSVV